MDIATIMSTIGTIMSSVFGWVGTVIDCIEANPLLLFVVLLPFIGIGIGMLRRLFATKA